MFSQLALVVTLAVSADPATQLKYVGTMTPVKEDGNPAVKRFTLTVQPLAGEEGQLAWTLEETGRGGWSWLDHFGRWAVTRSVSEGAPDAGVGPALLYEREDGKSLVPILSPHFADGAKLEPGATWDEGRLEYKVLGEEQRAGLPCWEIEVRSPYGHKRTLLVEKASGTLVVAVRETVFIGQGQEHKLNFELTEAKELTEADAASTAAALEQWLKLRDTLAWTPRGGRTELSTEQIATLKAELPKLLETSAAGPLATIAAAAEADAKGQRNRAGAVAALREAALGQPLGKFALQDIAGKPLTEEALAGRVVVLHFWEYRDTPLEEPYGQTGYLDYLSRRRGEAGVLVFGVTVADNIDDEQARRTAASSARKLKAFMNLSYPILLDDGTLLKRLGDPRQASGKLPLFVVIGKDGKLAEYHAGLYDVKTNEGLAELDAVIGKALAK
ncbi:MAG TPA: TlpA disulfide reductase family protein [Pirellulaceae bacterium]|nr:TlpA disulfide reductase family protein [Pirellulaceae bacterium]